MPGVDRVAFYLFDAPIYWYGIIIAAGFLLAAVLAVVRGRGRDLPKDTAIDAILLAIPVSIICARLYYVAFTLDVFRGNWLSIFDIRKGGMAIYGGVIGGVAACYIYARRKKIHFGRLADLLAPSLVLGQAIGRWGNFVNQEAYGILVTDPAWQFFPAAVFIEAEGAWHCATFFYESMICFIIFAGLLLFERRGSFKRPGDLFAWYLITYGAERALVEGLRMDSLYLGSIRVSQALSLLLMLGVCVCFLIFARPDRRRPAAIWFAACALLIVFAALPGEALVLYQALASILIIVCACGLYKNIKLTERGAQM